MIGYKVMRAENKGMISGADSSQVTPWTSERLSMPGNGVYLSTSREYVLDYYSGLADNEVLIKLDFNPLHITTGNLTDRDVEISVPSAKILQIETL